MTATASRRTADGPPPAPVRSGAGRLPLVLVAATVLVMVAVWVVAFSPALGVRTVTVTGTRTLTAAQVRTAAAVAHGAPLIRLDTAAVRKRVEALPDVASASVTVVYPSTVRIRVTERAAVGYVAVTAAGTTTYLLVDGTGAQYRQVAAVPSGLPRFALPTGPGAQATGHSVALVAAALSPTVLAQLAQISADTPESITLVLRDGRMVTWGSADASQRKAGLLPPLLGQPGTHIDLSNPDLAVVR